MKTNDKSLDLWLKFFSGKKDFNKWIALLKKLDKTFLSYENNFDHDHPLFEIIPRRGFLEEDFKTILRSMEVDGLHAIEEKTRLVIAMVYGVNFKDWKEVYGVDLEMVFAKALIDGNYEEYGIDLEKILKIAIENELIDRYDFIGISVIRGALLASRYADDKELQSLAKKVKSNQRKIALQSLLI